MFEIVVMIGVFGIWGRFFSWICFFFFIFFGVCGSFYYCYFGFMMCELGMGSFSDGYVECIVDDVIVSYMGLLYY